jgi:hypothetical protein
MWVLSGSNLGQETDHHFVVVFLCLQADNSSDLNMAASFHIFSSSVFTEPFNAGIKSLFATLPDEIFYWGFYFLNRAFRLYMGEKPINATINSIY